MATINKVDAIRSLHKGSYHKATEDSIEWKDGHTTTTAENNAIAAEVTRLQALEDYQGPRRAEYPSIAEQLDDIYHNGIDAWKATIKATKDKYPKP